MPDKADRILAAKSFFFGFQLFKQTVYIRSQRFVAFRQNVPDTTARQVELAYLSAEVPDMPLLQPAGHKLHDATGIVKYDPSICLAFSVTVRVHAVVFQQAFCQEIFERIKKVIT